MPLFGDDKELTTYLSTALDDVKETLHKLYEQDKANAIKISSIATELRLLSDQITNINKIVKDGNGQPSLLVRLAKLETSLEFLEKEDEEDKNEEKEESFVATAIAAEGEVTKKRLDITKDKIALAVVAAPGVILLIDKIISYFLK